MNKDKQIPQQAPNNLNELYNKYGGMLYGYIFEIVKDERVAGQHLVAIYSSLPAHINQFNTDGGNIWCQLRQLARKQLSVLGDNAHGSGKGTIANTYNNPDKFTGLMSDIQKQVFCSLYYKTKSPAMLAAEYHISENCVREILKEAFDIIKKG